MRTKILTITFLVILFVVAGVNLINDMNALKPVTKFALGLQVEDVETINDAIAVTETRFNDDFVTKYPFIEVNAITERLMGSWVVNERIKMESGSLIQQPYELDMSDKAESVGRLNAYLEEQGIPFMYVAIPNKIKPGEDEVRPGIETHSNDNVDGLLAGLEKNSVPYLDLRIKLAEDRKDWQDCFFITDHHWKPETAFWAYTEVAAAMNETMGFEIDETSMDRDNWETETYENIFLGSSGKRTGICFAGLDDFTLLLPKFETEMSIKAPGEMSREGDYRETMIEERHINYDYYNDNPYAAYIGGYKLVKAKNDTATNQGTLLILRDSYTTAMQPYMSFMFSRVDAIDLREYDNKTLKEYIDKTKPCAVLMAYSPGTLQEEALFTYGL